MAGGSPKCRRLGQMHDTCMARYVDLIPDHSRNDSNILEAVLVVAVCHNFRTSRTVPSGGGYPRSTGI